MANRQIGAVPGTEATSQSQFICRVQEGCRVQETLHGRDLFAVGTDLTTLAALVHSNEILTTCTAQPSIARMMGPGELGGENDRRLP